MAVAPASPFQWVGNQAMTPAQAQEARSVAAALAGRRANVAQNGWEGLAQLANAFSERQWRDQASQAEAAGQASVAEALAGLSPQSGFSDIASVLSNPWIGESPGGSAIASALLQQNMQANDPLRQLQIETAAEELNRMRNPPPPSPDYGFTFAPDGTLIRTDTTSGTFDPMGVFPRTDSGVTINNMGNIPSGYEVFQDPETGATQMRPIPGGPADLEAQAAAATEEAGQTQTERYGNVVTEDIGRALDIIEKDPTFTTGVLGATLANIGGTPANRVRNLIETVKSNVGFDRLQAMRESSPTGGALGSVTERELSLLTSAIGSLEQSNNDEDLAYNLKRVNKIYMDIIHGPGNWEPKAEGSQGDDGWQDLGGGIRIRPIGQ